MTMEEVIAGFKDLSIEDQQRVNTYAQEKLDLPAFPLTATFVRIKRFEGEQLEKAERLINMVKSSIADGELVEELASVEPAKGQAAAPHKIEETKKAVAEESKAIEEKTKAKAKAPKQETPKAEAHSGNIPQSSPNLPQSSSQPAPKQEPFDPMAVLAKGILPYVLEALPKGEPAAAPEEMIRKIVREEVVKALRSAAITITEE